MALGAAEQDKVIVREWLVFFDFFEADLGFAHGLILAG